MQNLTNKSPQSSGKAPTNKQKETLIKKILLCSSRLQSIPLFSSSKALPTKQGLFCIDHSLQSLSLHNSLLFPPQAQALASFLDDIDLSSLSLSNFYFSHLPDTLIKSFQKITILSIDRTSLTIDLFKTLLSSLPYLEKLKLSKNALKDEHVFALSQKKLKLQELHLEKQSFTEKAFSFLISFCKKNSQLTKLSLPHNSIDLKKISKIAQALEELPKLKCLDLSHNKIDNKGLKKLAKPFSFFHWKELSLAHNKISNLSALQKALLNNKSLELLNLNHNDFNNASIKALLTLKKKNIRILMHNNHFISPLGELYLAREKLKGFFLNMLLSSFKIPPEEKEHKESYCLFPQKMHDFVIKMQSKNIKSLDLENEKIDEEQIIFLSQYLQISSQISSLSLKGLSLSKRSFSSIIHALKTNTELLEIDFDKYQKNSHTENIASIQELLFRNKKKLIPAMYPPLPLLFESTEELPQALTEELIPLSILSQFARSHQLSYSLSPCEDAQVSLSFSPETKSLSLSNTMFYLSKAKDLSLLIQNLKVESIQIDQVFFSEQSLTEFLIALKKSSCKSLLIKDFSLSGKDFQKLCKSLEAHKSLRSLSIKNIDLSSESISSLSKLLRNGQIEKLSLSEASTKALYSFAANSKQALTKLLTTNKNSPHSKNIQIEHNQFPKEKIKELKEEKTPLEKEIQKAFKKDELSALPQLLKAYRGDSLSIDSSLSPKSMAIFVSYLRKNPPIYSLSIRLNEANAKIFSKTFPQNRSLFSLDIYGNIDRKIYEKIEKSLQINQKALTFASAKKLTPAEFKLLYKNVKKNNFIKLNVSSIQLLIKEKRSLLVQSLHLNTNIKILDITGLFIQDKGFSSISSAIANMPLEELYMKNNDLTAVSLIKIAEVFINSKKLKVLVLEGNDLQDIPDKFCSFIKNSSLTALNFDYCHIDDKAFSQLARGLKDNRNIKYLNLESNDITYPTKYFYSFLRKSSIEILNIGYNKLTKEPLLKILEALKNNTKLAKLTLWRNETRIYDLYPFVDFSLSIGQAPLIKDSMRQQVIHLKDFPRALKPLCHVFENHIAVLELVGIISSYVFNFSDLSLFLQSELAHKIESNRRRIKRFSRMTS